MKTIAILSQKGGSGKTTLALHMAVAAKYTGSNAIVADLDPQASAHNWYNARKQSGYNIEPYVFATHPAQLEELVSTCQKEGADFLFIDTAPQSDNLAVQAAKLADLVLITCKPSVMDLRAIQSTLRLTEIANIIPYVVLTQIEPHGVRHIEATETLKNLNVKVIPHMTVKRVAYMDALVEGQTVTEYDEFGKAADETRKLYKYITGLLNKLDKNMRAA